MVHRHLPLFLLPAGLLMLLAAVALTSSHVAFPFFPLLFVALLLALRLPRRVVARHPSAATTAVRQARPAGEIDQEKELLGARRGAARSPPRGPRWRRRLASRLPRRCFPVWPAPDTFGSACRKEGSCIRCGISAGAGQTSNKELPETNNVPTYPDLAGKVALVTGGSGGIGAAPADCTDPAAIEAMRRRTEEELGPVGVLAAFVGGGAARPGPVAGITGDD